MSAATVEAVKQDLERQGISLSGPCGAFEITKRVAWIEQETGIGLHRQDEGRTGCWFNGVFCSVDFLVYKDGRAIDCLGDAGGANTPQWGEKQGDASRWVAPMDPGGSMPPPEPTPEPEPDVKPIEQATLNAVHAGNEQDGKHQVEIFTWFQQVKEQLTRIEEKLSNQPVPPAPECPPYAVTLRVPAFGGTATGTATPVKK